MEDKKSATQKNKFVSMGNYNNVRSFNGALEFQAQGDVKEGLEAPMPNDIAPPAHWGSNNGTPNGNNKLREE